MLDNMGPCETVEAAFCAIRSVILSGEGPSLRMATSAVAEKLGMSTASAKDVLRCFCVDRYFDDRRSFKGGELTPARAEGWFDIFLALVGEATFNRNALMQSDVRLALFGSRDRFVKAAQDSEDAVLALVDVFAKLFTPCLPAPGKDLAAELLPPAFFRILWVSDLYGQLPFVVSDLCDFIVRGDFAGMRDRGLQIVELVRPAYDHFMLERDAGRTSSKRVWISSVREPGLHGQQFAYNRYDPYRLLPDLA